MNNKVSGLLHKGAPLKHGHQVLKWGPEVVSWARCHQDMFPSYWLLHWKLKCKQNTNDEMQRWGDNFHSLREGKSIISFIMSIKNSIKLETVDTHRPKIYNSGTEIWNELRKWLVAHANTDPEPHCEQLRKLLLLSDNIYIDRQYMLI